MGYETNFTGEIEITPPIPWKYIRESVFLELNARTSRSGRNITFRLDERVIQTDDGTLIHKEAVALVPTWYNYAGEIVAHVQEVVDAFPEHQFRGRIDAEGEEQGDVWRLKVVNRVAIKFTPELKWPAESE